MKKILSLTLAVMLLISAIPTAFAAEAGGNWAGGTQVEATGSRSTVEDDGSVTHNVEYTITVPAKLAPAGSGTVTLEGMWPSDATVKVTADPSVEMVNSINSADKKTLAVTFPSIEKAGDNTQAVSASAPVSVADISAALFGTWSGKFNYNVDYVAGSGNTGDSGTTEPSDPDTGDDGEEATTINFIMYQATKTANAGETWGEWIARSADATTNYMSISAEHNNAVVMDDYFYLRDTQGNIQYADTVIVEGMTYNRDTEQIPSLITFTIGNKEYQAEEGMTWAEWLESDYDTPPFQIDNDVVLNYAGDAYIALEGVKQNGDTVIQANANYTYEPN